MGVTSIVRPHPIAAAVDRAGTAGGTHINLLTPDPKEAFLGIDIAAGGTITAGIDLGAAVAVDTVAALYTNSPAAGVVFNVYPTGADFTPTVPSAVVNPAPSDDFEPRRHFLARFAPVVSRYWAVQLVNNTGAARNMLIGAVAFGAAFTPGYGPEVGNGRGIIDTGTATRRMDGGFAIDEGVGVGGWQFTLGDLTDAEVRRLYAIAKDRRETRSLLVVEDPAYTDGLNDRIHWCLFQKLDPYERLAPGATRWSLSVQDWA